jgi:putative SOS response-associated peptidase YedK
MCGRYANHLKKMSGWDEILGNWPAESSMSMNIAPTQHIPVVSSEMDVPQTKVMRWGLVPHWSKTAKPAYATFNARAESVRQKPAFRDACAKAQTCLIPASGYYEWSGEKGHKTKYYIQQEDETPLLLAGLWSYWKQGDLSVYSCTILTRSAVPSLADIHHRMPVILNREDAQNWLYAAAININTQLSVLQQYNDYPLTREITV